MLWVERDSFGRVFGDLVSLAIEDRDGFFVSDLGHEVCHNVSVLERGDPFHFVCSEDVEHWILFVCGLVFRS